MLQWIALGSFCPSSFLSRLFACLVVKSCPTLCDPMDCGPPGSFVHGILQARMEWVAISFSTIQLYLSSIYLFLNILIFKNCIVSHCLNIFQFTLIFKKNPEWLCVEAALKFLSRLKKSAMKTVTVHRSLGSSLMTTQGSV